MQAALWVNQSVPGNLLELVIFLSVSHYTVTPPRDVSLCLSVRPQQLGNKNMVYGTSKKKKKKKRDINEVIWHAPVSSNHSLILLILKN